jgi:SAM-dependent methyltransferase
VIGDGYVTATRAFFAPRAARWDTRFPDDAPAFVRAVGDLSLRPGEMLLDLGCGTGRAFSALRAAVGAPGCVVGLDLTPEMLDAAAAAARRSDAHLVLGDARELPFASGMFDAVFAAGLLPHLPDPARGLRELARVVRPDGQLALFHPVGRAALAARHGHSLRGDEPLDPRVLPELLQCTGWEKIRIVDDADRYLAVAQRFGTDSESSSK